MSTTPIDNALKLFSQTASQHDANHVLQLCQKENKTQTGLTLGNMFCNLFPTNASLLETTASMAYAAGVYGQSYDLYHKLLSFGNLPANTVKTVLFQQHQCIPYIYERYTAYREDLVGEIVKRTKTAFPLVTFTITSCKRLDLFEKTVNSFLASCEDVLRIDDWFCVDDMSSDQDRKKMQQLYPFFTFYLKTAAEKGHPRSMNIIRNHVKTPYLFHVEDDWAFFCRRPYITECLDALGYSPMIAQCLINKNYAETGENLSYAGGLPFVTVRGQRFFRHEHYTNESEKRDFIRKYGENCKNCGYWPGYSFRPSMVRTDVIRRLGEYQEKGVNFEQEYSVRYRQAGFMSVFFEGVYSWHLGRKTWERFDDNKPNAYTLNDEKQFGGGGGGGENKSSTTTNTSKESTASAITQRNGKIASMRAFVVNLARRPDRWDQFRYQKEAQWLHYNRFEAVDGNDLVPTEQLQRIFDGNDYDMRAGMVGCAMSHIELYISLLKTTEVDAYLIMEDDITVVPDFQRKFIHMYGMLPDDWDLCYLGHHPWNKTPDQYDKIQSPSVFKAPSAAMSLKMSKGGTGGYVISKKGAKALLDYINRHGMTNGIDTVQQKAADAIQLYYCTPHLIYSDCWSSQTPTVDTDIQHNFVSLTVPFETRKAIEEKFYSQFGPVVQLSASDEARLYVTDEKKEHTMFYTGSSDSDVRELLHICKHPCYSLNYKMLVCVPKPNETIRKERYFERLKKNGEFSVDDALVLDKKKQDVPASLVPTIVPVTIISDTSSFTTNRYKYVISISETTHVAEAIQANLPEQKTVFPFDKSDGGTLWSFYTIIQNIMLSSSCEEEKEEKKSVRQHVQQLSAKLFDFDKNTTYHQAYNNRTVFKNNLHNISYPHDDAHTIVDVYSHRFQALYDAIYSKQPVLFVHGVRWLSASTDEQTTLRELYAFLDCIRAVNSNVKILCINSLPEKTIVDPKYSDAVIRDYIDFPEHMRKDGWPADKIQYDQGVFRPALIDLLRKYV